MAFTNTTKVVVEELTETVAAFQVKIYKCLLNQVDY